MVRLGYGEKIMGAYLIRESVKAEHFTVFSIIALIAYNFFVKSLPLGSDISAFIIFVVMCCSAYLTFKAAKEILVLFDEYKFAKKQNLDKCVYMKDIYPIGFSQNSKFSKYATGIYLSSLKLAS